MYLLTIDPSIHSAGVALFDVAQGTTHRRSRLIDTQAIKTTEGDWIERLDEVCDEVYGIIGQNRVDLVLIEQPMIFHTGRGAAAANSESIMKLCALVFSIRQMLIDEGVKVKLIPVRKWKGQTPKSITAKRVWKYWGFESDNDDIVDAVGIGDYWIRKHAKLPCPRSQPK